MQLVLPEFRQHELLWATLENWTVLPPEK